jgi:hypothetical protein
MEGSLPTTVRSSKRNGARTNGMQAKANNARATRTIPVLRNGAT